MPMRRPPRARGRRLDCSSDGWTPEEVAVLRHSTLPWPEERDARGVAGVPLEDAVSWGERDRLSLLAQMAGHLAFLRDSGVRFGRFVAAEWLATRARGEECRLRRLARQPGEDEAIASFLTRAAEFLRVEGVESLVPSWVKPDAVWIEIDRRFRGAKEGWRRRAGMGWISTPGIAAASRLLAGEAARLWSDDDELLDSVELLAQVAPKMRPLIRIGGRGASPVQPYSGVAALTEGLAPSPGAEAQACEEIERRLGAAGAIVVIRNPDRLDSSSLRLIRLLASSRRDLAWVWSGACAALPDCEPAQAARTFFVAARLAPLAELRRAADR
ncbi:MAG: hypothetical protein ACRD2J_18040, partial [Thermoanaerobaculia bacterium]